MVPDELVAWSEADDGSIGHVGEWETSLQLALRPELTDMSRAVDDMWEPASGQRWSPSRANRSAAA